MAIYQTQRLLVRRATPADFPAYLALVQDAATMRYGAVGSQTPQDLLTARATFARIPLSDQPDTFLLQRKQDAQVIGVIGLSRTWTGTWEIGYTLTSRYWHHGYATEAARGAIRYLFGQRQAPYVYASIMVGNSASAAVAQRCGLRLEGVARNNFNLRGQLADEWRYGITAAEYATLKASK